MKSQKVTEQIIFGIVCIIMTCTVEVSVITKWSITYLIMSFMCTYAFLPCGNALVPVGTMEKGFHPSLTWPEISSNTSKVKEETQQHMQKENIQTAFQNHYLQYPSPQLPSEANQWAPATPSTQPPPPPPSPQHYSVSVSIQQPDALILLCQVQEPLEHISWLWYPCPNHHSAGEGTLIADGTTVSNTSLYGVRIIGQNGLFISELHILQNPLQSGIEGLYRCEAWPHGPNKDIINQTSSRYHDEFIIGGHLMVKSCFYDPHRDKYYYQPYGPMSYSHKLHKHYRTPRKKIVPDDSINVTDGSVK